MEGPKDDFLRRFGDDYGYPNSSKSIEEMRATEFKRLEGLVYLDHAGATLYSEAQLEAVFRDLSTNVYGNPHSQSDSSKASSDVVSEARQQTGCFCNPGACAKFLSLSHSDILFNLEKFLTFLMTSFMTKTSLWNDLHPSEAKEDTLFDVGCRQLEEGGVCLKSITVYPIKSCAGFTVSCWPLVDTGLKYDREWLLRGPNGEILTQKKVPRLCHIRTFIDLKLGALYLESQFCKDKLRISFKKDLPYSLLEEMDVYGQRYLVHNYDHEVNKWFIQAISLPCTFVRCSSSEQRSCVNKAGRKICRDVQSQLNFANEAQLLLISKESVDDLNVRLRLKSARLLFIDVMRFRPNLVISGAEAYVEDTWTAVHVGKARFSSLGGCNRCQMINIDQENGEAQKSKEPLATLATYRRVKGKILFGVLLRYENAILGDVEDSGEHWLEVGQKVYPSIT